MNASDDWSCHCGKRFPTLREVNQHQRKCFPRVPLYRSTAPKVAANFRAQVKDLKARLAVVEKAMQTAHFYDLPESIWPALDLRLKEWR